MGAILTPANEVYPRIYVGNYKASQNAEWIRAKNITVIVNSTKDLRFLDDVNIPVKYRYRVPVDDNLEDDEIQNLAQWAPEAVYRIIQHWKCGETILIHCAAGMQRSAAIAAMVVYVLEGYTHPAETIQHIKRKRPIAFLPSAYFKRAIYQFAPYYDSVRVQSK